MSYQNVRQIALKVFGMHPETEGDLHEILKSAKNNWNPASFEYLQAKLCRIFADFIDTNADHFPDRPQVMPLRSIPENGINEAQI